MSLSFLCTFLEKKQPVSKHSRCRFPSKHHLQHDTHLHLRPELWQLGRRPLLRCQELKRRHARTKSVRPTRRKAIKWALKCQTRPKSRALKEGSRVFLWPRHSVVSSRCSPFTERQEGRWWWWWWGGYQITPPPSHPATLKRIPFDVAAALL